MRFPLALLPVQDQRAPLIDEVRPKIGAQHLFRKVDCKLKSNSSMVLKKGK
jgi:hypothetical protein